MIATTAMRALILILLLAGMLAIPQPASEAVENGNRLYAWLLAGKKLEANSDSGTREDLTNASLGLGFVIGVDTAFRGVNFCVPDSVTNGQLLGIARQYLEAHPEDRHLNGAILVSKAIAQKFPCRK